MSAGVGPLDDQKIRGALIMAVPHFEDNAGGFFGRNDGSDLCIGPFYIFRHIHRKAGAGDDHIGARLCRRLYIVRIIPGGCHDIIADQSVAGAVCFCGNFFCLFQFADHGSEIRFF